ncbi:nucleolar protein 6 [Spea bombifrons]|uniref:nucleolar protein 6 n=1 Tax=Spea bombifrons TaxID=233779 RepID=UPI002349D994|nr:nucleolar protein 6 [Spea bombifrons]
MKRKRSQARETAQKAVEDEEGVRSEEAEEPDDDEASAGEKKAAAGSGSVPGDILRPVKLSKAELYKPPTNEELNRLKETEHLFHSNILRMQIEELLQEVKLKEKRRKNIDNFLHRINSLLGEIPETQERDLADQSWLPKSVKVPVLQIPYRVKGRFRFQRPSSIKVVGSYLLGTCIKPEINVDLALTLPREILQEKDNLNQRYFRKRALYLAHIAAHLADNELFGSVKFSYMNSNHLKPILLLRPHGKDEKLVTVRIHVCPPPGVFKASRLFPNKNNVRTAWFTEQHCDKEGPMEPATPHYNTAILSDLAMEHHLHHLSSCATDFPGMKDGIAILKVWLRQRQLDKGRGSFNGFVVSMLVAYLLSKNKINKVMSGYQVLRNTLQFLAATDLTVNGIAMSSGSDHSLPSLADFQQAFEVVFVDPLGLVNLCADMTAATYRQIQFEAQESLKTLDDTTIDGFHLLLMVSKPFIRTFDHVFHLTRVAQLQEACKKMKLLNELMDRGGDYVSAALPFLLSVLNQGLGKRVALLSHTLPQTPEWSVGDDPRKHKDVGQLSIGLLLTTEFYSSVLEKGPAADSPEAAEFRKFWGEKSELRRFQDGSICEAVVWPGSNLQEKRRIPELVVKHLLGLHADVPESCVAYAGNLLDCVLVRGREAGTGEEHMVSIVQSYDDLSRKLWNLEDLPLTVTSVQGTHPALRYTDVFPPVPVKPEWSFYKVLKDKKCLVPLEDKPCPAYISPVKVICHMEGSGKWPQDKDAIKRVKAAFQIRLAELLRAQHNLPCKVTAAFTDVYKDGYVFRVHVAYHREPQYIKEFVTPEGMLKSQETEESRQLELETLHSPHLTSTLHGLHQQHPAFGGTSRLAKRWINCQLLGGSFSEECVDLLVAHLFLHPAPFSAPSSPQVGFLRFLHLLATFDWKNSPLIVNLNGDLKGTDFTEIQNDFVSSRMQLPVMFIATPRERKDSVWTRKQPSAQILQRLILLSVESLRVLEKQLMDPLEEHNIKMIFRPSLNLYDVLIRLNPKQIPRHREALDTPLKSFVRGVLKSDAPVKDLFFPVVDYDPVQLYLNELREAYEEFALFFYDSHGGEVIGVLWKPSSFEPQPFKTTNANGRIMDKDSSPPVMIPNVEAILEDFRILGEGLVHNVETRTEKWAI